MQVVLNSNLIGFTSGLLLTVQIAYLFHMDNHQFEIACLVTDSQSH